MTKPRNGMALAVALCAGACAGSRGAAPAPARWGGAPLELAFRDLAGRPLRLRDLRGKVVLIDFFASWCDPCRDSLPFYADLEKRHGGKVVAVAVGLDEEAAPLRRFVAEVRMPSRVVHDPAGRSAEALSVAVMPTMFVLDKAGRIAARHESFVASDRARIESIVAAQLR